MSEVLNFFLKRSERNIYRLPIPPVSDPDPDIPLMTLSNTNSTIYNSSSIPSGIIRTNISFSGNIAIIGNNVLASGLMTITLNDEYKSFASWNITFESRTGGFPDGAKYIIRYSSGSGIFLRPGYVVIDVSLTLLRFYFVFDKPNS
jgi:hypothetical protein